MTTTKKKVSNARPADTYRGYKRNKMFGRKPRGNTKGGKQT